jgi:hypothetical protein
VPSKNAYASQTSSIGADTLAGQGSASGSASAPLGGASAGSSYRVRFSVDTPFDFTLTGLLTGSRFVTGQGYAEDRYEPTAVRRFGIDLLQKSISTVLGRPWHDATSGMIAANARALPILARPYTSGAPEVEALIRLHDEGLRVEEVAVHMRERSSGESKLQGKKAVVLVLTVIGTLATAEIMRRRRRARGG